MQRLMCANFDLAHRFNLLDARFFVVYLASVFSDNSCHEVLVHRNLSQVNQFKVDSGGWSR